MDAATIERLTSDNEELTKQLTDTAKQVVAESEQKSLLNKVNSVFLIARYSHL